jgi:hypothetical protein
MSDLEGLATLNSIYISISWHGIIKLWHFQEN